MLSTIFNNIIAQQKGFGNQQKAKKLQINGLMQEKSNTIANALELCFSCTYPSICIHEVSTWGIKSHTF